MNELRVFARLLWRVRVHKHEQLSPVGGKPRLTGRSATARRVDIGHLPAGAKVFAQNGLNFVSILLSNEDGSMATQFQFLRCKLTELVPLVRGHLRSNR